MLKHICLWVLSDVLQHLQLVFSWCQSCRQVTGPEFLLQLDTFFNIYHYRSAPTFSAARCHGPWWIVNLKVGVKMTYLKSCVYVALSGYSSPQYHSNSAKYISHMQINRHASMGKVCQNICHIWTRCHRPCDQEYCTQKMLNDNARWWWRWQRSPIGCAAFGLMDQISQKWKWSCKR